MAAPSICEACFKGDHKNCEPTIVAVAEHPVAGERMLGGVICVCDHKATYKTPADMWKRIQKEKMGGQA